MFFLFLFLLFSFFFNYQLFKGCEIITEVRNSLMLLAVIKQDIKGF